MVFWHGNVSAITRQELMPIATAAVTLHKRRQIVKESIIMSAPRHTPPYVPFRTLKTHLSDLKEHGMPNRIDGDVLRKMGGSAARQLKTSLRFLGLTDS